MSQRPWRRRFSDTLTTSDREGRLYHLLGHKEQVPTSHEVPSQLHFNLHRFSREEDVCREPPSTFTSGHIAVFSTDTPTVSRVARSSAAENFEF